MKILIISPGVYPVPATKGGAVENLIQMLITSKQITNIHDITIYTVFDKKAAEIGKEIKVNFKYIYDKKLRYKFGKILRYVVNKILRKFGKYIGNQYIYSVVKNIEKENENYDIIIVENEPEYVLKLNKIKKNAKVVLHLHNDYLNKEVPNARRILDCCDSIYTISNFLKQRVNEIYCGKAKTLYNGIDLVKFNTKCEDSENLKQKYGFKEDDFIFMYSGRLVKEKGVKELIEAFCKLENVSSKLLIVGKPNKDNDEYYNLLINLAEKRKKDIKFLGYVNYEEINKIYSIINVGIVPSIWNEPFGLVIIEFLASGKPVVTSDKGASKEIVDTKAGCGKIVKYNEEYVENLKNAMKYYINLNKSQFEIIKENCFKNASRFSKDIYIQNFLKLVKEERNCEK